MDFDPFSSFFVSPEPPLTLSCGLISFPLRGRQASEIVELLLLVTYRAHEREEGPLAAFREVFVPTLSGEFVSQRWVSRAFRRGRAAKAKGRHCETADLETLLKSFWSSDPFRRAGCLSRVPRPHGFGRNQLSTDDPLRTDEIKLRSLDIRGENRNYGVWLSPWFRFTVFHSPLWKTVKILNDFTDYVFPTSRI